MSPEMPGNENRPSSQGAADSSPNELPGSESGIIEVTVDEALPPDKQIAKLKRFLEAVARLALPEKAAIVENLILRLVLYTNVVTTMERLRYSMILFQQRSRLSQVWTQQQQQQRRDTSLRLEEVQRKADVTVQEVKKAAVLELQKAVQVAERKAMESIVAERNKWEKIFREAHKQEDSTENCWNCGRKAGQTCSGCGIARYCGIFCQHKDWEKHRSTCTSTVESRKGRSSIKVEQERSPVNRDATFSEVEKSPPKSV